MRTAVLVIAMGVGAGCVTQRSLSVGQLAAGVGKGAADINVFTGVMYQSQTHPPTTATDPVTGEPINNQLTSTGLSVPWFEANANYGFTDQLGLNLHMSPAGLQPGLKITLNKSRIANIALLPQVGFGYASYSASTTTSGVNGVGTVVNPTFTSSLIFTAGLKLLISHRSGFFFGAGYDLVVNRAYTQTTPGNNAQATSSTTLFSLQHQIAAAVGMSIKVGFISIRPELAFAVAPAISGTRTTLTGNSPAVSYSAGGGSSWAILPGFGFALTSPPDRSDTGADEDEKNVGETEEKPEEAPPEREREDDT